MVGRSFGSEGVPGDGLVDSELSCHDVPRDHFRLGCLAPSCQESGIRVQQIAPVDVPTALSINLILS